ELAREALIECRDVPGALAVLQAPAQALEQSVRALRAHMEPLPLRGTLARLAGNVEVEGGFDDLDGRLSELAQALDPLREASPGLDACHGRAVDSIGRLARWRGESAGTGPGSVPVGDMFQVGGSTSEGGPDPVRESVSDDDVRWYEL